MVLLKEAAEEAHRTNEPASKAVEGDSRINTTITEVAEVAEVDALAGAITTSLNAIVTPQSTFVQIGP